MTVLVEGGLFARALAAAWPFAGDGMSVRVEAEALGARPFLRVVGLSRVALAVVTVPAELAEEAEAQAWARSMGTERVAEVAVALAGSTARVDVATYLRSDDDGFPNWRSILAEDANVSLALAHGLEPLGKAGSVGAPTILAPELLEQVGASARLLFGEGAPGLRLIPGGSERATFAFAATPDPFGPSVAFAIMPQRPHGPEQLISPLMAARAGL